VTLNDLERRNSPNGTVISPNSVACGYVKRTVPSSGAVDSSHLSHVRLLRYTSLNVQTTCEVVRSVHIPALSVSVSREQRQWTDCDWRWVVTPGSYRRCSSSLDICYLLHIRCSLTVRYRDQRLLSAYWCRVVTSLGQCFNVCFACVCVCFLHFFGFVFYVFLLQLCWFYIRQRPFNLAVKLQHS